MMVIFFIAILFVCLFGWGFTRWLVGPRPLSESLGLSFLLGFQIFTLSLFILNVFFGVHLSLINSWLILSGLILLVFWGLKFHLPRPALTRPRFPSSRWQNLILFILVFLLASTLFISFWRPVVDWDAVNMFDYRSKIILRTGWISDTFFRASAVSYPFMTTLSHYWLNVNGIASAMPLYPLFFAGFILVSYSLLSRVLPAGRVLPGLLLLAAAPKIFDQALIAYANLPYTVYLILGGAYLYLWTKDHHREDLVLGVLLSFLSLWVRSFPFVIANFLAVLFLMRGIRKPVLAVISLLGVIILAVFFWPPDISRLIAVIFFTKWAIFDYYFPYTVIFLFMGIWGIFSRFKNNYWLVAVFLYFIVFILGSYYYAGINENFSGIPDAARRMTMFISPAVLWLLFSLV